MNFTYLNELFKQYADTVGGITKFSKEIDDDFISFVARNYYICNEYKKYLQYLGIDIFNSQVLEINKGKYDSISCDSGNIMVISNYGETLGLKNYTFSLLTDEVKEEVYPLYFDENKNIYIVDSSIILTHNPYDYLSIRNWFKLHNVGKYDISIGMYGDIADKNKDFKINILKNIYSDMNDDCSFDYDTDEGKYFCSLNSRRKVKKKILTL